jgi:hypothetical protein
MPCLSFGIGTREEENRFVLLPRIEANIASHRPGDLVHLEIAKERMLAVLQAHDASTGIQPRPEQKDSAQQ